MILETVPDETVAIVETLVEGMGFDGVIIRGLNRKTFLAYFHLEDSLENIDLDFLGVAFHKVRKVHWEDLIPARHTWVECRGIPAILWIEENLRALFKDLGNVLQFSPFLDENLFYQNPRCLIETRMVERIEKNGSFHSLGKKWFYKLIEDERTTTDRKDRGEAFQKTNVSPEEGNQPLFIDTSEPGLCNHPDEKAEDSDDSEIIEEISTPKTLTYDASPLTTKHPSMEIQDHNPKYNTLKKSLHDESLTNSLINPVTPPHSSSPQSKQGRTHEEWNWCPQGSPESEVTEIDSIVVEHSAKAEDNMGENLQA